MKLVVALGSSALFLAGVASCSSGASGPARGESPPPASASTTATPSLDLGDPAGAPEAKTRGPILATVVTRDAKVAIVGSGSGKDRDLRVVVRKLDGAIVADGLTLAELRARDPFLSVVVESAVAGSGAAGAYVDATRGRPAPKPMLLLDM